MAIELKKVSFSYPNGFEAVHEVDLRIEEGEKVAIVGQNGAGKTTTVKLMNGLNLPSSGDVLVDGINTKDKTCAFMSKYVGYVFQNPDDQIFNSSVRKELEYMPKYTKMDTKEMNRRVERAVELTGIQKYIDSNPFDIPYPIRKFVTIASIIVSDPKYFIFDEPTAGQDLHGMKQLGYLIDELQKEGKAIITITHDMEFAVNNFTRVVAMAHKQVIKDGTREDTFWDLDVIRESRIKQPVIAELAHDLGVDGNVLFCDELVAKL
ncbi:MAG: ABC transporter ATP-binding protein [Oscillospiraceae bacterium]|nr:ABC transporter ATP-binding protein [Oscillospiraceae bacterium]